MSLLPFPFAARGRALACALLLPLPAHAGEAFFDGFDTLDDARWYISDGWSNGPHQGCTWEKEQVNAANGRLVLRLTEGDDGPACGEIQTRKPFGHGLFEVSMRAADAPGIVSALFTYTGPSHGNPHDEIDIEILGKDATKAQLNYFTDGDGDHADFAPSPGAADGFVQYGFEWAPDALRWFIDGKLVREEKGEGLPTHPQRLYVSLWNGTDTVIDWLGKFDPASLPLSVEVDWISFTPAGTACAFEQSISCRPDWQGG